MDGGRVKKVSGSTTTYTFFGHYEEEVTDGVTTAISHYSFGGLRVAVKRGNTLYHLHGDHLGSTSLTTAGSAVEASRAYYAYGSERSATGDLQTDRTFTGQKRDATGLMYYNARYYDPALGTFISPDSMVPGAGQMINYNRFLYARGNPLSNTDPTGHCPRPRGQYAKANIICVASFIPTATSTALPKVGPFYGGDNRDFSHDSALEADGSSRVWVWIDADSGQIVRQFQHGTQRVTRTNGAKKGAEIPARSQPGNRLVEFYQGHNELTSKKNDDGSITFNARFVCSHWPCNKLMDVNVNMTFHKNRFGSYDVSGQATEFPDFEAYYWEEGELKNDNVLQIRNISDEELRNDHAEASYSSGMLKTTSFVARQFFPGQGTILDTGQGSLLDNIRSLPEATDYSDRIPF